MFVVINGEIACDCHSNQANFYLAKNVSGITQNLIIDFGTFGQPEWIDY